jgi:hypothetical protein
VHSLLGDLLFSPLSFRHPPFRPAMHVSRNLADVFPVVYNGADVGTLYTRSVDNGCCITSLG